jgi:hypothetical protein
MLKKKINTMISVIIAPFSAGWGMAAAFPSTDMPYPRNQQMLCFS